MALKLTKCMSIVYTIFNIILTSDILSYLYCAVQY